MNQKSPNADDGAILFPGLIAGLLAVTVGCCAHRDPAKIDAAIHKNDMPANASALIWEIKSSPPVTVECKVEPVYKAVQ